MVSTPPPADRHRWARIVEVATRCVARVRRPEHGAVLHAATKQRNADVAAQVIARTHGRDR